MSHSEPVRLGVRDFPDIDPEEALSRNRKPSCDHRVQTTVIFTDIVNSTMHLVQEGDVAWLEVIDSYERVVRDLLHRFGGRLVRSLGDGTLATFGDAGAAIAFAQALRAGALALGFELRIGLHTGEVHVRRGREIGGLAVHIAARVEACAGADEILVSGSTTDSVAGSGVRLVDRGLHELRGVPGEWRLYGVIG
jgi:class 3 adenylate cyclase